MFVLRVSIGFRYGAEIAAAAQPNATTAVQAAADVALQRLHQQVLPFILRRMKRDVLQDLPAKTIQDVLVELTPTQRRLYDRIEAALNGLDTDADAAHTAGASSKVKTQLDSKASASSQPGASAGARQTCALAGLQLLRHAVNHPQLVLRGNNLTIVLDNIASGTSTTTQLNTKTRRTQAVAASKKRKRSVAGSEAVPLEDETEALTDRPIADVLNNMRLDADDSGKLLALQELLLDECGLAKSETDSPGLGNGAAELTEGDSGAATGEIEDEGVVEGGSGGDGLDQASGARELYPTHVSGGVTSTRASVEGGLGAQRLISTRQKVVIFAQVRVALGGDFNVRLRAVLL